MTHPSESAASLVILLVGLVCLALLLLGVAAFRRTRNRKLLWLVAAFALFTIKSFLTSWALWAETIGHEYLELVMSLFDLGIVGMLVAPFLPFGRKSP